MAANHDTFQAVNQNRKSLFFYTYSRSVYSRGLKLKVTHGPHGLKLRSLGRIEKKKISFEF